MKIFKLKLIILFSVFCILISSSVSAAILSLQGVKTVGVGKPFVVRLMLNAEGEFVNAYEGKVTYDNDFLQLREIRDGNSIVNFWIERPKVPASCEGTCVVSFAGITPGGYSGSDGFLFSMIFVAKREGSGEIGLTGARVLRHDGEGTPATLTTRKLTITAVKSAITPPPEEIVDNEPPDPFTPYVGQSPEIFDGKYFLVFTTQDKQSGIAYYEVYESRSKNIPEDAPWEKAESPYLIKDQTLKSYLFVRATDKAGNTRIGVYIPTRPPVYKDYQFWVIIILAIIAALLLRKLLLWRRKRKKSKEK